MDDYGMTANPVQSNNAYGLPGESGGHLGEFSTGITGETNPAGTASLRNQDPGDVRLNSQQFQAQVPRGVSPVRPGVRLTSVLQPLASSANGMSAADASRRTFDGQYLGSINATSVSSFEPSALRRMAAGQDTQ